MKLVATLLLSTATVVSVNALSNSLSPYGTRHQDNGQGGAPPLRKTWTTDMTPVLYGGEEMDVDHEPTSRFGGDFSVSEGAKSSMKPLKPYGIVHQGNGHGGKGPLSKEWIDSQPAQHVNADAPSPIKRSVDVMKDNRNKMAMLDELL